MSDTDRGMQRAAPLWEAITERDRLRTINADLVAALGALMANRRQKTGEAVFLVLPECEAQAIAALTKAKETP